MNEYSIFHIFCAVQKKTPDRPSIPFLNPSNKTSLVETTLGYSQWPLTDITLTWQFKFLFWKRLVEVQCCIHCVRDVASAHFIKRTETDLVDLVMGLNLQWCHAEQKQTSLSSGTLRFARRKPLYFSLSGLILSIWHFWGSEQNINDQLSLTEYSAGSQTGATESHWWQTHRETTIEPMLRHYQLLRASHTHIHYDPTLQEHANISTDKTREEEKPASHNWWEILRKVYFNSEDTVFTESPTWANANAIAQVRLSVFLYKEIQLSPQDGYFVKVTVT